MDYNSFVAKIKALISYAVTAQLICVSVFAYAKNRFSHNEAHFMSKLRKLVLLFFRDESKAKMRIELIPSRTLVNRN